MVSSFAKDQHSGRVSKGKAGTNLEEVVLALLLKEGEEPAGLTEVFERALSTESSDLVAHVEGIVLLRRVDLTNNPPVELKAVAGAHLPEVGGQLKRQLGHQELVEDVRLRGEIELPVADLAVPVVDLLHQRNHLGELGGGKLRSEHPRGRKE